MARELVNATIAAALGAVHGSQKVEIAFKSILEHHGLLGARKAEQVQFLLNLAESREEYRSTLQALLGLHTNLCSNRRFVESINGHLKSVRMRWDCSENRVMFVGPEYTTAINYDYIENGILPPEPEYKALEYEINELAISGLLCSCAVMKRKLVENLMIDLLRAKYPNEKNLFLTKDGSQYKMYYPLVESIKKKKEDFHPVYPGIDTFISSIERYREPGNIGAHNIVLMPISADVVGDREEFMNILRIFRRLR